jgi:hypothetical protein
MYEVPAVVADAGADEGGNGGDKGGTGDIARGKKELEV